MPHANLCDWNWNASFDRLGSAIARPLSHSYGAIPIPNLRGLAMAALSYGGPSPFDLTVRSVPTPCNAHSPLHTFPRNFLVDGEAADLLWTCAVFVNRRRCLL